MTSAQLSTRLAAQTWAWLDGETGAVLAWLQQVGCVILSRPGYGRVWMLQGVAGTNAALCTGMDPPAVAQALGFLLGGIWWLQVFPGFLAAVNAEWGRRMTLSRRRAPAV